MKKVLIAMLVMVLVAGSLSTCFAADKTPKGPKGPAPNSGDGIPDGSGF